MAIDLSTLKRSRTTDVSAILEKYEATGKSQQSSNLEGDPRFWQLEKDKLGNGSATIRFLPNIDGDEFNAPWIPVYSFGFQGPGGWYVEESLKTLGQPDPALEYVNSLWATKDPKQIEIAKSRAQRNRFISNIYVVNDPTHPENNGKVFMFRYGKDIHNKLLGLMKPAFEDIKPINPFDLWDGANFRFRMRKKDNRANYDDSTFSDACPVSDSDEEIVEIMRQRHNIQEFLYPEKFKTYDELKARLDKVLYGTSPAVSAESLTMPTIKAPEFKSNSAPSVGSTKPAQIDEDDDDELAYFSNLALDD